VLLSNKAKRKELSGRERSLCVTPSGRFFQRPEERDR
jgi:hypothetical protein